MRVAGARMGRIVLSSLVGLLGVCLVGGGAYWFFMVRPANAQPREGAVGNCQARNGAAHQCHYAHHSC